MKKLAILGSTGSIGKNTLDIVENMDEFSIIAMSANCNYRELYLQAKKHKPKYLSIGTKEGYDYLKKNIDYNDVEILYGKSSINEIGEKAEYDILVNAVSGTAALEATIQALKRGKRIAIANKEILVSAGEIIIDIQKKYNGELIPVDSEHSAIFQALKSGKKEEVKKIILTASGGAFRDYTLEQLQNVSLEDALNHPNWDMGKKITVDSATLINKGLEVIEAKYLFGYDYERIDVIMHPESIIHSMVEYNDNSIIAQLGTPDMRIPIQYALTYPDRKVNNISESIDFTKFTSLTFKKIDRSIFKGLDYAYEAGKIGRSMPIVLNASNEVAVEFFIKEKIKFLDIYKIIAYVMENHNLQNVNTIEDVIGIDKEIREKTLEYILKKF